jgi:hypothetical protein
MIADPQAQDYFTLQRLLEETIGGLRARLHPLIPVEGARHTDVLKKYSTGLKSLVFSPTSRSLRLFGNVLYEYNPALTQGAKKFPSVSKLKSTMDAGSSLVISR